MIYTVTFNPALDYVIAVDHFAPGQINRTKEETMVCGGKGINVSALLANLGYESTALGFVAGFTGEEIVRRCQKAGFHSDFIRVKDGLSRINVKMKSNEETEINGMGPDITGKNVEQQEYVRIQKKILQKSEKMSTCRLSELLREIIRIAKCTLHQR